MRKSKILIAVLFGGAVSLFLFALIISLFSESDSNFQRLPSSQIPSLNHSNFIHVDNIRLVNFEQNKFFLISNTDSFSQLSISNEINDSSIDLDLELSCDQNFQRGISSPSSDISKRNLTDTKNDMNNAKFHLGNKHEALFLLSKNVQKCRLSYKNTRTASQASVLDLRSEALDFSFLKDLIRHKEICNLPVPDAEGKEDSFFTTQRYSQLSCIHPAGKLETLETPESGFLAKTEMLLGRKLDPTFIESQNPYGDIDFSQAPQLDAIFVATLVYRADFYGTVLARILKFHADRGTVVHLMTTGYMMLQKDKQLLFKLAAENGNFRLQTFKYNDPNYDLARPARFIDSKYRDMHIKLFITLAKTEKDNAVVLGGRNIHDGFLFTTKPDYSRYPDLVQYGVDDDFVHWNDFEMKITSTEVAKMTAAHFLNFWNRDTATQTRADFFKAPSPQSPPTEEKEPDSSEPNELRHFISLPYKDGHALENLYISLINSAKKTIRISSPYLRPTTKIMQAIKKAADRKVNIIIQTRVSLMGDTQAWLYEEVNKASINQLFETVQLFEWKENSILHSKFILIDDEVGFIGSVNLSRRSFVQDVENGFIIRSPEFISQMSEIFNSYLTKSKQITEAEKRKILPSIFIQLLKNQF